MLVCVRYPWLSTECLTGVFLPSISCLSVNAEEVIPELDRDAASARYENILGRNHIALSRIVQTMKLPFIMTSLRRN